MSIELTILMPCLNEAETIVTCIEKAKSFLMRAGLQGEILVADNGSSDGSQTLAKTHGARVIEVAQRGYGAALMAGIQEAAGRYVIMGDADDSYDFCNLSPFVEKLSSGYELVIGNRFKGGIEPKAMPFLNKYLGNPVLSFLGRLFFRSPIKDFHCGLRGFHRQALVSLNLTSPGMEFASEMIIKASLGGLKMTEVPTKLSPDGRSRLPHLRKWRDGWRHLRLLLLFSPNWMFLFPGILFAFLGFTLMSILTFIPIKVGRLAFDIHTLLFASGFLIIGLQAIFFAVFAQLIGHTALKLSLPQKLKQLLRFFTLERGILLGITLIFLGLIGSIFSVIKWMEAQFGILIPQEMMRLIIPSLTLLITGTQTIFASFFLNLVLASTADKQRDDGGK